MTAAHDVAAARAAYARRDWSGASDGFEAARTAGELSADDSFALADAAWWLGDVERSVGAAEEAYRRYLHGDRPESAAMAAMTIAMNLLLRGDVSLGSGWMRRAVRLVSDRPDTVEYHYLRYLTEVEGAIDTAATLPDADVDALIERAREAQDAGQRFGVANLVAAGMVAEGRVLLKRGVAGDGIARLDEAMLCLLERELDPDWAGSVYCHLMAACHEVGDIGRAREWTAATEQWLDGLPAAVLFRGICRVHRSQVLQTLGDWDRAEEEAARVCTELAAIAPGTAAEGHYQVGELRRWRGDLVGAQAAYERAHAAGRDPQPGLALLWLARGRIGAAVSAVRTAVLARAGDRLGAFPLRVAQVEIALAAGEMAEAEEACSAVEHIAEEYGTSGFAAEALAATGAVALARGQADAALPKLRDACRRWRALGAHHHAARVCLLLAATYDALGAPDAAELERTAAVAVFERLRVPADVGFWPPTGPVPALPDGLTEREAEVLRLVAAGRSNKEIADSLMISQKTVARHLSNIFVKIGARSRTEAAAYAFAQRVYEPPRG